MPYDGVFAAAILRELQEALVGARIDKIYQPTPDDLLLHVRRPGEGRRLLISAHPRHARVHLTAARPANPLRAPVFAMTLRKHLDPGRIVAVEQHGLDRVVSLVVDGFDDEGRPARRRLVAELTGRHSNVVLVEDDSGRVVDALKRVSSRVNLYRALLPGETYVPPPSGGRVDPRRLSPARLAERIAAAWREEGAEAEDGTRRLAVLPRLFEGISPFGAREAARRAGPGGDRDPERLADGLHRLLRQVEEGDFAPTLKLNDRGEPVDFWAFAPWQWADAEMRAAPSANDAADAVFTRRTREQALADKRRVLARGLRTALKRLERKAAALARDLEDAAEAEKHRVFGELLTANMHLVDRGSVARVPNYYADGEIIDIPLDPTLGPAANAQRYFKRYTKLKTAATVVRRQLDATEADMRWLEGAALHVDTAATEAELDETARELLASGMLPRNARAALTAEEPRRRRPSRTARPAAPPPPREARVSGDVRVLIGGSGRQNDRLSLRIARPDDWWFHVKDVAGAHVLVPRDQPGLAGREEPPRHVLVEAAALAAYFSKARRSANVPVDWTLAKHVRKPRGARPGMVVYDHHRTVYVTPDEAAVLRQLAAGRS